MERLNFEEALTELQSVVQKLQQREVPLDEAVSLYRQGTELAQRTEELLSQAELQVQKLTTAVQERFAEYSVDTEWEDGDET